MGVACGQGTTIMGDSKKKKKKKKPFFTTRKDIRATEKNNYCFQKKTTMVNSGS